jgi:hypothetical protein
VCYRVKAPSRIGRPAHPELAHTACRFLHNAVVLCRMPPATIMLSERALRDNPGLYRLVPCLDALGVELKAVAGCVPGVVLTVGTVDIPGGETHHGFLRAPGSCLEGGQEALGTYSGDAGRPRPVKNPAAVDIGWPRESWNAPVTASPGRRGAWRSL